MRAFLAFLLFIVYVNSITTLVRPKEEECYFTQAEKNEKFHCSYTVTANDIKVNIKVFDPEDKTVFDFEEAVEDSVTFYAQKQGFYTICFTNPSSEMTTIEFTFHVGSTLLAKNLAQEHHFTPLEEAVEKLFENVDQLEADTWYHYRRLKRSKRTSESTNSRIMWWSIFETVCLLLVAAIQVLVIKSFFDRKARV
jgi:hypothetical protein